jgi:hypothetical protein
MVSKQSPRTIEGTSWVKTLRCSGLLSDNYISHIEARLGAVLRELYPPAPPASARK